MAAGLDPERDRPPPETASFHHPLAAEREAIMTPERID